MKYLRHLRIAFSITCGIACVLLVVLWARSHWREEFTSAQLAGRLISAISVKQRIIVSSLDLELFTMANEDGGDGFNQFLDRSEWRWSAGSSRISDRYQRKTEADLIQQIGLPAFPGFSFRLRADGFRAVVPHWSIILAFALLAAAPWLPWRFSLRTLLIAITLAGVILGTIIAITR